MAPRRGKTLPPYYMQMLAERRASREATGSGQASASGTSVHGELPPSPPHVPAADAADDADDADGVFPGPSPPFGSAQVCGHLLVQVRQPGRAFYCGHNQGILISVSMSFALV
ncbi:unnamed protein product [Cochlearia groenlandica]